MLVSYALVHPEIPSTEDLIHMMVCLQQCPTVSLIQDERVVRVLNSFQRIACHQMHPPTGIPLCMKEALNATVMWDEVKIPS